MRKDVSRRRGQRIVHAQEAGTGIRCERLEQLALRLAANHEPRFRVADDVVEFGRRM